MATATFGDISTDTPLRAISFSVIDASGDTWAGKLYVAVSATLAAIQAWLDLYQAVTQTSIFAVRDEREWVGDADPDNADDGFRAGKQNGINLLFKDAGTTDTFPLRVVGPVAAVMQGNQDIPLLTGGSMDELIIATIGLAPTFGLATAQYTARRERSNNPRIKA